MARESPGLRAALRVLESGDAVCRPRARGSIQLRSAAPQAPAARRTRPGRARRGGRSALVPARAARRDRHRADVGRGRRGARAHRGRDAKGDRRTGAAARGDRDPQRTLRHRLHQVGPARGRADHRRRQGRRAGPSACRREQLRELQPLHRRDDHRADDRPHGPQSVAGHEVPQRRRAAPSAHRAHRQADLRGRGERATPTTVLRAAPLPVRCAACVHFRFGARGCSSRSW